MGLNSKELFTAMQETYTARIPLCIIGDPGIGKTEMVNQFAASIGAEFRSFNAGAMDPSTFGLTCVRADNSACDLIPTAQFVEQAPGSVQFIDELNKMDTLIQNTMLPFVQENKLHGLKLTDRWTVSAANYSSNGKGQFELSPILRNRMCVVEYDGPTVQEWVDHATKRGGDYRIISFLEQPQYSKWLKAFNPKADASPTPRQWMNATKIMNSTMRATLMRSIVGTQCTAEFEVFDKITSRLPSYQALLACNGQFTLPDDYVLQSIMASMLGVNLNGADAKILKPIIDQLPVEFIISALRRAMLRKAPGIEAFIATNNYVQIMHSAMV